MGFDLGGALGALSGVAGLFGRRRSGMEKIAERFGNEAFKTFNSATTEYRRKLSAYDPTRFQKMFAQVGTESALKSGRTLGKTLQGVSQQFAAGGGDPGRDTGYSRLTAATTSRAIQELAPVLAELETQGALQDENAFRWLIEAGGILSGQSAGSASTMMQLAQAQSLANGANVSSSVRAILAGLESMKKNKNRGSKGNSGGLRGGDLFHHDGGMFA